jgi:CRISPR/Cas system-associated endonuclease Cas1
MRRLQKEVRYHGEAVALRQVMEHQARRLVRHIEGKELYKPFVLPW